jgi:hypothetical protein
MRAKAVVTHFGGVAETCKALACDRQTVYYWLKRKKMPELPARRAHEATRGKLRFDPKLYPWKRQRHNGYHRVAVQ